MSKFTIDISGLSPDERLAAKNLIIAAAEAKAEAQFNEAVAKAEAEAAAEAAAEAEANKPENVEMANLQRQEEARLKKFKDNLFDVEEEYDCYVVNGQLGKKKLYRVFNTLTKAKQFSADILAIGGRIYTHEPISCKIK